jgi:Flp pilus assembly protein TadG
MSARCKGSQGSTLVEFAIVLPLLAIMTFGIVELGMALQDKMTVQGAARTGVRVGSAAGTAPDADKNLLLGAGAALHDVGLANVNWILVYKSATADGAVPVACTNPPHSVAASCNAYTGAQLQQLVAGTAPSSWFGCGATALDRFWCPTSRQTIQSDGTDYLGVSVEAQHPMLTGFFGSTLTIGDHGVMRLEPQGG